jgi:hypothetical protein
MNKYALLVMCLASAIQVYAAGEDDQKSQELAQQLVQEKIFGGQTKAKTASMLRAAPMMKSSAGMASVSADMGGAQAAQMAYAAPTAVAVAAPQVAIKIKGTQIYRFNSDGKVEMADVGNPTVRNVSLAYIPNTEFTITDPGINGATNRYKTDCYSRLKSVMPVS